MPINDLKEENLNSVLDIYRMGAQGNAFFDGFDCFKKRCLASIDETSSNIILSDDFGEREVAITPQVYTYDLKPNYDSEDLCVGCATSYILTDNTSSVDKIRDVIVIDFCLMPDFYENDIVNRFIRSICESIYEDFSHPSTISFYILEDSFHFESLVNSLTNNHFTRVKEPREQLVWHDPPLTHNLQAGSERLTRNIHRYVLDVQRSIDPFDGFREYQLNHR